MVFVSNQAVISMYGCTSMGAAGQLLDYRNAVSYHLISGIQKTTTSDAEHAEEGFAEGRKERMHSSTHYAEVLTHTALPPDVPHSPSNMESFETLMDDDVRRIHDARSKVGGWSTIEL